MMVKVSDVDPRLPHQIIIQSGRTVNESSVSCNCMRIGTQGNAKPMGFVANGEGTVQALRAMYADPKNHNQYMPVNERFHPAITYGNTREVEVC